MTLSSVCQCVSKREIPKGSMGMGRGATDTLTALTTLTVRWEGWVTS